MCLSNVTTTGSLIAEEDITVYKFIEKSSELIDNWKELVNHGDDCIAVIDNETVQGKISINFDKLYICTDNPNFEGKYAEDMLGYKYSWVFDNDVKCIIINGENIIELGYRTIYQKTKVVIGKEYTSELICEYNDVSIGLHSYIKKPIHISDFCIVECIIPKGSKYFIGDFDEIQDSIASDTLKYVKIIN